MNDEATTGDVGAGSELPNLDSYTKAEQDKGLDALIEDMNHDAGKSMAEVLAIEVCGVRFHRVDENYVVVRRQLLAEVEWAGVEYCEDTGDGYGACPLCGGGDPSHPDAPADDRGHADGCELHRVLTGKA